MGSQGIFDRYTDSYTEQESLKNYRDWNSVMAAKELKGFNRGMAEGIEKGREEGERNAMIRIARNLLDAGQSLEKVAQITGLSTEELRETR